MTLATPLATPIAIADLAALGLSPDSTYRVADDLARATPEERTGASLVEAGLRVRIGGYGAAVVTIEPAT